MNWWTALAARKWLLYLVAGVFWVTYGAVVFGYPRGIGLNFVGLFCLSAGAYGAAWRVRHGYGLTGPLSPRPQRHP